MASDDYAHISKKHKKKFTLEIYFPLIKHILWELIELSIAAVQIFSSVYVNIGNTFDSVDYNTTSYAVLLFQT